MASYVGRKEDAKLLDRIARRCAGDSTAQIAAATGASASYVRAATNRVLQADLDESGEDRRAVRAGYWGET